VSGHSLKLHFCMFERSQVKNNSLDCHKFFGIFFINYKAYILKVLDKSKMFLHVQNIQTSRVDNFNFFFSTKCASFLLKIREDFNIGD
jgi:hypothetical protein